jgi:hypothetical protein
MHDDDEDDDPQTVDDLIYQRDCYRDQAHALAGQLAAMRAGNFEVCAGRDGRMAAARFAWDGDGGGEPMGGPALVVGFDGDYLDVTYRGFLVASFNFDTQAHGGGEVVDVSVGTAEDVTCRPHVLSDGGMNATVEVAP